MNRHSETEVETAEVVDTLLDGRGVARPGGKTVFVRDSLAGETVAFRRQRRKRSYDEAELVEVLNASAERVVPRCEFFGICGGCSLQHVSAAEQVELKQASLLDHLQRIGGVAPARILEPVTDSAWGYRRKARLAVKDVRKKGRVLVGFRERNKPYVANMTHCETLHPELGQRLEMLSDLIGRLSLAARIPQIEAAVGENGTAMIFRVLDPPTEADLELLGDFQREQGLRLFLQRAGPDSIAPLNDETDTSALRYTLPEFDVVIEFEATDFIQAHAGINSLMVGRAMELLDPCAGQTIVDLFCGLGNFTLPVARRGASVTGLELSPEMVNRARANATLNGLAGTEFQAIDLSAPDERLGALMLNAEALLLDPPRTGAAEALEWVEKSTVGRIVYVSCHPGTLARDAGYLVKSAGFELVAAGIMDMFPQTSHVESMVLFERS